MRKFQNFTEQKAVCIVHYPKTWIMMDKVKIIPCMQMLILVQLFVMLPTGLYRIYVFLYMFHRLWDYTVYTTV
jgi:hypothetical protein